MVSLQQAMETKPAFFPLLALPHYYILTINSIPQFFSFDPSCLIGIFNKVWLIFCFTCSAWKNNTYKALSFKRFYK